MRSTLVKRGNKAEDINQWKTEELPLKWLKHLTANLSHIWSLAPPHLAAKMVWRKDFDGLKPGILLDRKRDSWLRVIQHELTFLVNISFQMRNSTCTISAKILKMFLTDKVNSLIVCMGLLTYVSHLFGFRIHLLLAAGGGEHHHVCSNAQGCHQRGGELQTNA